MKQLTIEFGKRYLKKKEIRGKNILEVGSRDVNGSLRYTVEEHKPKSYIGTDIEKGKGTDMVVDACDLVKTFGKDKFDMLICTETLDRIKDWRKAVSNIKQVVKSGGVILITSRSKGYPELRKSDFWRFGIGDMRKVFSDFTIDVLKKDPSGKFPGVMMRAKKPKIFIENDLRDHQLYRVEGK